MEMNTREKKEMKEVCQVRKECGLSCHNCNYCDVCSEYQAKVKARDNVVKPLTLDYGKTVVA